MSLEQFLQHRLHERQQQSLYRQRRRLQTAQGPRVEIDGAEVLAFSSNDYLGLANHPEVKQAFIEAAEKYGVGSGASHLVSGHSTEHHALEEELAEFTGRDRTLLFSSGYMANLGVLTALVGKGDYVYEDKLNHASLLDAGLLSGARFQRYLHNDMDSLQNYLLKAESGHKLIVTDGVFSMDGDIAPLKELAELAQRNDAWLMVDDAHGFGVMGFNGGGSAEQLHVDQQQLPILVGTLGKAFGTFGAFVAGSDDLIENLIQFARSYIYTTALPPAVAAASRKSLALIQQEDWRREKLHRHIQYFRAEAHLLGLDLMDSHTAIQPVVIGDSVRTQLVGNHLLQRGLLVGMIRPPTVPEGTARLRITLSAEHSREDIDRLLEGLKKVRHA